MNFFLNKKYCEGQALMTAVFFFMVISLIILAGLVTSVVSGAQISRDLLTSKKSYFLAEAGSEDAVYRVTKGKNYSPEEVIVVDGFYATTTILDVADGIEIESVADASSRIRKVKVCLTDDVGVAFHYGVQVDEGGVVMDNSAMITGNLYSNGPVVSLSANVIKGDVVSAGPTGFVVGVYATGTVYANRIGDDAKKATEIDKDAYYSDDNISTNTFVLGDTYRNSPDQPFAEMPIPDELIEDWKSVAANGTVITAPCPYIITTDTTIGPAKIECDLEITGNPTITLAGAVWVEGNINVENNIVIEIDSSLGKKSIPIIADKESDRLNSSQILLKNNAEFYGSGTEGSYVLFISQNNSVESGGSNRAIEIENNATGDLLLYAGHGEILLKNNINLREVTAYKIHLQNNANVIYETGLANLLFDAGPAGGFSIISWREVE